jgi:hypothetical protein
MAILTTVVVDVPTLGYSTINNVTANTINVMAKKIVLYY